MNEEQLKDEIAAVVERLAPGIVPWDRREAVDEIFAAMQKWLDYSYHFSDVL